ncbi:hypothetical protein JD844_009590 [Phrynosoma platyrhinos]|uniref:Uncharacterized protein n=1 Tax=Phrynosoma platyrhinos TaxID=52577 RepID=A0ABQ7TFB9_PHRPL|nr:hypothetical protein JD844_009590 [Phrynosoma platyrhinos]
MGEVRLPGNGGLFGRPFWGREAGPVLKKYQYHKQPEYIYQKNREKLIASGVLEPATSAEKRKWPASVEPMLTEIYEELREQQLLSAKVRLPTPPKQPRSAVKLSACLPSPTPPIRTFEEPEAVIKANITDPLQIIRTICENKNLGFLYMTPAVPRSSTEYEPYNLKIVSYDGINKNDYYTISPNAIIHTCNGEVEYLELQRWEQEYLYHRALSKITIFAIFRKWKSFNVWRKNVRSKKINMCRRALQKNLFIVNACLRPAILNIQEMCYQISDLALCQIEKGYIYTLVEFRGTQLDQLKEVASRLSEFRELAKEVVRGACRTALLESGFTPDDYFYATESSDLFLKLFQQCTFIFSPEQVTVAARLTAGSAFLPRGDKDLYGEQAEKMTYTEQANKRHQCGRLTWLVFGTLQIHI